MAKKIFAAIAAIDHSEIILICRFAAQVAFLVIVNDKTWFPQLDTFCFQGSLNKV